MTITSSEPSEAKTQARSAVPASGRSRLTPPWWFALPALILYAFVVLVPSGRGVY